MLPQTSATDRLTQIVPRNSQILYNNPNDMVLSQNRNLSSNRLQTVSPIVSIFQLLPAL